MSYGQKSRNERSLILPGTLGRAVSSGGRYPSSSIPHVSCPDANLPLHLSQTSASIIVSRFRRPKSGNEKVTSPVTTSMLTTIFASSLTRSKPTTILSLIRVQSSCFGMNSWTKESISPASNTPSAFSNLCNSQSRMKDGSPNVLKRLVCVKSLNTAIDSKHLRSLSVVSCVILRYLLQSKEIVLLNLGSSAFH